ncbi:MAG: hypothetical protein Terrestrivirus3_94 [Terrestrivirus sp.]|uniref:Uncharacterized protein n=1 Tax=Terrestrivirus sp. TaxID=2487775 RepID=A0A3G4ZLV7_9VIRU|nr:MAG: hypothetical protein Terrestrivirus3_94 [Terrestrivirus sp.]
MYRVGVHWVEPVKGCDWNSKHEKCILASRLR